MNYENRLNFRFEAVDYQQLINETNHSLRQHSKSSTNNQINKNENYLILPNGEISTFTNKNEKTINLFQDIKNEYEEVRKEHKKIFKESRNETLPKTRKSYSMFLMSFPKTRLFSKLWNEKKDDKFINREKLLRAAENTIKDFCKKFNTDYQYLTLHTDEAGELHFQGMVKNFDKNNGQGLNVQRNKENGEICQDIMFKHFKEFGFDRGISKEITKKHHLTTEEYIKLQKKEQMFNQLEEENIKLQEDNQKLQEANKQISIKENQLNALQGKYESLKTEYQQDLTDTKRETIKLTNELEKILKDMEDFIQTESDKGKWEKMKELMIKYGNKENVKKLQEQLSKAKRTSKAIKKKYQTQNR